MEAACKTLAAFAKHTRHSVESPSELAQKWIAVHVQSAPAPLVYTQIAHDYALVNLRTFEPPLSSYASSGKQMDPDAFVYVMKNGYPRTQPIEEFAAFRDAHFRKPIGEEVWIKYRRDTHWKERAYYMAVQCGLQHPLIEAIYKEDVLQPGDELTYEHKDRIANLYAQFVRHARLHASEAYGTAEEIGALLQQLSLPIETLDLEQAAFKQESQVQGVDDRGPPQPPQTDATLASEAAITFEKDPQDGFSQPTPVDCSIYRKAACLPPSFQVTKLMMQMVAAKVGAPVTEPLELSRWQQSLAPSSSVGADVWTALKTHIFIPATLNEELSVSVPMRELHNVLYRSQYRPRGTATEFVRLALDVYAKGAEERSETEARYVTKYPTPDATLMSVVLKSMKK